MIDYSKWFANKFSVESKNYVDDSIKIDLNLIPSDLKLQFIQQVMRSVTTKTYENKTQEEINKDTTITYKYYFNVLNCSNLEILKALHSVLEEI